MLQNITAKKLFIDILKKPPETIKKIIKYAKIANKSLKCSGITRVDFRVNKNKDDIYVLEINTQPG